MVSLLALFFSMARCGGKGVSGLRDDAGVAADRGVAADGVD
jgi:predicted small lipoprotein YifL